MKGCQACETDNKHFHVHEFGYARLPPELQHHLRYVVSMADNHAPAQENRTFVLDEDGYRFRHVLIFRNFGIIWTHLKIDQPGWKVFESDNFRIQVIDDDLDGVGLEVTKIDKRSKE